VRWADAVTRMTARDDEAAFGRDEEAFHGAADRGAHGGSAACGIIQTACARRLHVDLEHPDKRIEFQSK